MLQSGDSFAAHAPVKRRSTRIADINSFGVGTPIGCVWVGRNWHSLGNEAENHHQIAESEDEPEYDEDLVECVPNAETVILNIAYYY